VPLKHFISVKILMTIYYALIYPHLTYGILIWANMPKSYLNRLQVQQNKCLRNIKGWQTKQKLAPPYVKYEILNIKNAKIRSRKIHAFVWKWQAAS